MQSNLTNRQIQLAARPNGLPVSTDFELATSPIPSAGGKVLDGVLPLLNTKAHVPVCGLVEGRAGQVSRADYGWA